MLSTEEIQAIVLAANMYYKDHLNQQEIANRLSTTRQSVSKMLRNAEKYGIVEFRIRNPLGQLNDLSDALKERFGLKSAVVAPCSFDDPGLISSVLAPYAGKLMTELIENEDFRHIGVSWGRTLYQMIPGIPPSHFKDATVFPLVGAGSLTAPYFMVNEMARRIADALNADMVCAYIPADPGSSEDAALFRRTAVYESIRRLWSSIDLAVVGIGVNPREEKFQRESYPGERTLEDLSDTAVGDVLTHYFDANGNFLPVGHDILCADVEDLRRAKRMLAVAGGRNKTPAVVGALRTGLVTDLVTDEETCTRILNMREMSLE